MMGNKERSYSSMQIVCFTIGKEEYGIEILKVQEIYFYAIALIVLEVIGILISGIDYYEYQIYK